MVKLHQLTLKDSSLLIKKKKISSFELTRVILKRIEKIEPAIKAFITLTPELALKKAREVDKKIAKGIKISKLAGIPMSIKDVFVTKGIRTTTGSKILGDFVPPYDATTVKKLKRADAVIIGKANQDEFARGFTTETSSFQTSSNPWDLNRTPGGSSGGSAAGVAAGESIYSLCSGHCDSIRQPAAWSGVVGLKPTYGRVSRYGIVAMASSLECPGPITKTVMDAAIVLETIAGKDVLDANTANEPVPKYSADLSRKIKGLKLGIPREYFSGYMEAGVRKRLDQAFVVLEKLGAKLVKIKLFPSKSSTAVYEVLYASEVASNLARYDGIRYGYHGGRAKGLDDHYYRNRNAFGPMVKAQILTDLRAVSSGEFDRIYHQALKVRRLVNQDFKRVFNKIDLVIGPMSPGVAFEKGFYRQGRYWPTAKTEKFRPLVNLFAHLPTLVGLPGISVPCGFSQGLPVGLQIYGPQFSEVKILNAAYAYEFETQWYKIKPKLN